MRLSGGYTGCMQRGVNEFVHIFGLESQTARTFHCSLSPALMEWMILMFLSTAELFPRPITVLSGW